MKNILVTFLTQQAPVALVVVLGLIAFFLFLRREFRYENKQHKEVIESKLKVIESLLTNHITDTNKKIEDTNKRINELKQDMKEGFKEVKDLIKNTTKTP